MWFRDSSPEQNAPKLRSYVGGSQIAARAETPPPPPHPNTYFVYSCCNLLFATVVATCALSPCRKRFNKQVTDSCLNGRFLLVTMLCSFHTHITKGRRAGCGSNSQHMKILGLLLALCIYRTCHLACTVCTGYSTAAAAV